MSDRRRKLTAKQVSDLRAEKLGGATYAEVAKKYDISIPYAWKLVHGTAQKGSSLLSCPHCHKAISYF